MRLGNDGVAAVEFAVIVPFFLVLLLCIADLGQLILSRMEMSQVLSEATIIAMRQIDPDDALVLVNNFLASRVPDVCSSGAPCAAIEIVENAFCDDSEPCEYLTIELNYDVDLIFSAFTNLYGGDLNETATVLIQ